MLKLFWQKLFYWLFCFIFSIVFHSCPIPVGTCTWLGNFQRRNLFCRNSTSSSRDSSFPRFHREETEFRQVSFGFDLSVIFESSVRKKPVAYIFTITVVDTLKPKIFFPQEFGFPYLQNLKLRNPTSFLTLCHFAAVITESTLRV